MPSFLYCTAKEIMLGRTSICSETGITCTLSTSCFFALIKSSYTADQQASTTPSLRAVFTNRALDGTAGHVSQSNDVAVATPEISSSAGITFFDADNAIFISTSTGQIINAILIYKSVGGVDATSVPIAYINVSTTTANGATINVNWDNGVNRIFALTG